ncbi:uncharacterized protein Z520_08085 [Fonsecaea multimorphosa CBS 102226]|uniref:Uncharacterized protein n=1 Tax=Fonsecaea multimorphosa CBS 102226 TaxID=1442371 RepID=A0A0D2JS75_9EURO|nr:uncharacterized protein Z520_08085 [Fonsecaea multimorphosa CBS 102226]KIX96307.1 hypothetical protein Z520_08085 [Fonsecaea multimorphosa CBS 102226]
MAPLQVNPSQYTNLEYLLIHTIYALSFCILLCILILFRQIRNQSNRSELRNHRSESAQEDRDSKQTDQHLMHSTIPLNLRLSTESSHRVRDSTSMRSAPITSGYLAAKAKLENARKVDFEVRARARKHDVVADTAPGDETRSIVDDTGSAWRRHSYPPPSPQGSLLSEDCKFDGTEHFCDGQDARIVWRRRTLTFEGRR